MYCESCGSFIPDGMAFCSNCGTKVAEIIAAAPQPAPAPAPAPAYAQQIPPAPPITQGAAPQIPQAPSYQSVPITPAAGQPLAQSIEVDSAYAKTVQLVPPKPHVENPMAKAGLICGIISMATMYFGCLNLITVVLGITFAIKGLLVADKLDNKPKAITGLILSCVGGATGIYATVIYILNWTNMLS